MVSYKLLISERALSFIKALPPKSQRIVIERCKALSDDPFPGKGDKEIIRRRCHEAIYRLHISRSFTAFYKIDQEKGMVKILDIMTIELAHKRYGRL